MTFKSAYSSLLTSFLSLLAIPVLAADSPAAAAATTNSTVHSVSALSQYDRPRYDTNFSHFDYVNPKAPKGGELTIPIIGTFDTLNPYVLKGIAAASYTSFYGFSELNEPLMIGASEYYYSGDEARSAYCLICQTIEYPDDYSWVVFNLNPAARFHNGEPITATDVSASYHLLISETAHPQYADGLRDVKNVVIESPHRVRFILKGPRNRSTLLQIGSLPVMSAAYWKEHTFGAQAGSRQPLSGPYRIRDYRLGQFITLERVAEHWAHQHPAYRGQFNFDQVRFEFFRDRTVAFESFKAGNVDFWYETVSRNWETGYDFPALTTGAVARAKLPHQIPAGAQGFFLNTRRPPLDDRRVREALALLFDFRWLNEYLFFGAYRRTNSYYPNSDHNASGLPSAAELALLQPWREALPESVFTEPFEYPFYANRADMRAGANRAMALLDAAGWEHRSGKLVNKKTGQPFRLEILENNASFKRILNYYAAALRRIGMHIDVRLVDSAQYKVRLDAFDFDMTAYVLPQPPLPGAEQRLYFHSAQAARRGSRNLSGVDSAVVDSLLAQLEEATSLADLNTTAKALDRVLLNEHYAILQWYSGYHRLAWRTNLQRPPQSPPLSIGLQSWWAQPQQETTTR